MTAKRPRATNAQQAALDVALVELIERAGPPCTARQVYYMAVGAGLIDKTANEYRRVLRRLAALRENDALSWDWIADNTRWVRRAKQWRNLDAAVSEWQSSYRRDYWEAQPYRIELWVESDSIASFLIEDVYRFGLPLFVCRGQASRTYVRAAAAEAQQAGKAVRVLYCGDFDPSGLAIDRSLAERRNAYGNAVEVDRIAVTVDQVRDLRLVGSEAKRTDPNFQAFARMCAEHDMAPLAYEAEAIAPATLRGIVRDAIVEAIDGDAWAMAERLEAEELRQLHELFGGAPW